MTKVVFNEMSKKTNVGSLGFRYALVGYYTRTEYFNITDRLTETFGKPNFKYQFTGISRYGICLRNGGELSRWFAGPKKWTSPPGKPKDHYAFAFRSEKDRLLASMIL